MRQRDRVLRHLTEVGPITSRDAFLDYGIYDLPKRISELRQDGHQISGEMVTGKNRFGESVSFKRYSMEGVEE